METEEYCFAYTASTTSANHHLWLPWEQSPPIIIDPYVIYEYRYCINCGQRDHRTNVR